MIPKYEPATDQLHKLKTPKNDQDFLNVPNDNNVVVQYQDNGLRKKRSGKWLRVILQN